MRQIAVQFREWYEEFNRTNRLQYSDHRGKQHAPLRRARISCFFVFTPDQWVNTPYDERGLITMLGHDHSGHRYLICCQERTEWWREAELRPAKRKLPLRAPDCGGKRPVAGRPKTGKVGCQFALLPKTRGRMRDYARASGLKIGEVLVISCAPVANVAKMFHTEPLAKP